MGTRLYVGNLPFSADESQIRDLFSQNGRTVSEVKLVTDRETGRPRGFGFVEMETEEGAQEAIKKFNGGDLDGKTITVNEARPKTESGGGQRRDGGGFRGGRGGGGGSRGRY